MNKNTFDIACFFCKHLHYMVPVDIVHFICDNCYASFFIDENGQVEYAQTCGTLSSDSSITYIVHADLTKTPTIIKVDKAGLSSSGKSIKTLDNVDDFFLPIENWFDKILS